MSPRRIVQISLWQIVVAFAAVTAAFIVATAIATDASNTAAATAKQAKDLAVQNRKTARDLRRETERTTGALCALRADLRLRIRDGERVVKATDKFIREHPEGFAGIPVALLKKNLAQQKTTLDGQRRTRATLAIVKCPPG